MIFLRFVVFIFGGWLVGWTLKSAIRTFVLPRSQNVALTSFVFRTIRKIFNFRTRRVASYEARDRVMALFAPISLLTLPVVCLVLILLGYTAMFWATGVQTWADSFVLSGSSLFTLGFATDPNIGRIILIYSEATLGLGFVALLISYLPTMYGAFSARERIVGMLEVRAGEPPSAVEMIKRFNRLNRLQALCDLYADWEVWFADIEETHTSLAPLVFFRSPQPSRSWVTASGAILDGGALFLSCIKGYETERFQISLCLRAGYIALRRIADLFSLDYDNDPQPQDAISITKNEFIDVFYELKAVGVPVVEDIEQAWIDFRGWRVNYDAVLIQIAGLTMAPYAPWSSDRSLASH